MNGIAYLRVSTIGQAEHGISLDAQDAAAHAYAVLKGIDLVGVLREEGVSGGKPLAERHRGAEIMRAVRKGEVQAVIVTKLDRAFRDAADCLGVVKEWDKRNVSLHILDLGGNSIDTASAAGRFMLTVLAGAAEMERNLIGERTCAALAHKASRGEKLGGDCPFGYDAVEQDGTMVLVPNLREQAVVSIAKDLRAKRTSYREIAEHLNCKDYTAKRGGDWFVTQVKRLLDRAA